MIEGYTCYLDTEKISGTVETLKSIDSCLSNKDLKESFYEMEEILNKYNFEHGNFTTTYKETLSIIEDEITKIKKEIYDLSFGVERTTQILSEEKEKTVRDIQDLSPVYDRPIGIEKPSDKPISVLSKVAKAKTDIAEVITSGVQPPEATTSNEINTVPIGIGIGVAGAVGAIGAIAYDSIRGKERIKIEDYRPSQEESQPQEYLPNPEDYYDNVFEDVTPYNAIHDRNTMDKFYGENNNNHPE